MPDAVEKILRDKIAPRETCPKTEFAKQIIENATCVCKFGKITIE